MGGAGRGRDPCLRVEVSESRIRESDTSPTLECRPSAERRLLGVHRREAAWNTTAASNGRSRPNAGRSEEHTSELQSLMRISYAVFCLKKKNKPQSTLTSK